jgi:amino-acid N-acetyltransferase
VERGELPLKAWKDCLRCPKFQCCDEIAMVRILEPQHWAEHRPHSRMDPDLLSLIQIPVPRHPGP